MFQCFIIAMQFATCRANIKYTTKLNLLAYTNTGSLYMNFPFNILAQFIGKPESHLACKSAP